MKYAIVCVFYKDLTNYGFIVLHIVLYFYWSIQQYSFLLFVNLKNFKWSIKLEYLNPILKGMIFWMFCIYISLLFITILYSIMFNNFAFNFFIKILAWHMFFMQIFNLLGNIWKGFFKSLKRGIFQDLYYFV